MGGCRYFYKHQRWPLYAKQLSAAIEVARSRSSLYISTGDGLYRQSNCQQQLRCLGVGGYRDISTSDGLHMQNNCQQHCLLRVALEWAPLLNKHQRWPLYAKKLLITIESDFAVGPAIKRFKSYAPVMASLCKAIVSNN